MLAEPFAPSDHQSFNRGSSRLKRSRSSLSLLTPPATTDTRMDSPGELHGCSDSEDEGHGKPSGKKRPCVDVDPFNVTPTRQGTSQRSSRTNKTVDMSSDCPDDPFQDSARNPFLEGSSGVSKNERMVVGDQREGEPTASRGSQRDGRKMVYVL
jgi:hypothetical protein